MLLDRMTRDAGKDDAVERRPDGKIAVAGDQRARHVDLDALAALFKDPAV